MSASDQIKAIQQILGVTPDGSFGPVSRAALDVLTSSATLHVVKATSFADPADVAAYRRAKAAGKSDEEAFAVGDNGVGCWGDDCTTEHPFCALPPEDMCERWGSVEAARHRAVKIVVNGVTLICPLGDRMPSRRHITNGAGIDLNPAACAALHLTPPVFAPATWQWA